MNFETIRDNLVRTIKGKQALLEDWKQVPEEGWIKAGISHENMSKFVRINIDELQNILSDVEQALNPKTDYWIIKKVTGTKDEYYVAEGNPPQHAKNVYGIQ